MSHQGEAQFITPQKDVGFTSMTHATLYWKRVWKNEVELTRMAEIENADILAVAEHAKRYSELL